MKTQEGLSLHDSESASIIFIKGKKKKRPLILGNRDQLSFPRALRVAVVFWTPGQMQLNRGCMESQTPSGDPFFPFPLLCLGNPRESKCLFGVG